MAFFTMSLPVETLRVEFRATLSLMVLGPFFGFSPGQEDESRGVTPSCDRLIRRVSKGNLKTPSLAIFIDKVSVIRKHNPILAGR